jgi:hypothetical protein
VKYKRVYLAWAGFHLLLIFLISSRQTMSVASQGGTLLPSPWNSRLARSDETLTAILGENFSPTNPFRAVISGYTYSAGIETGYGFFAPSVPAVRKLVFEIRYPDGHVEYELPRVGAAATGIRLVLLFDNIERIDYEPLREMLFKMMSFSVWREHRDSNQIRAVFGNMNIPNIVEFESNQQPSYEVLFAYDFFPPDVSP